MTTPNLLVWAEDVHNPRLGGDSATPDGLCPQVVWRLNPDDGLLFICDLSAGHTGDHEGFEIYNGLTNRRLTWSAS